MTTQTNHLSSRILSYVRPYESWTFDADDMISSYELVLQCSLHITFLPLEFVAECCAIVVLPIRPYVRLSIRRTY